MTLLSLPRGGPLPRFDGQAGDGCGRAATLAATVHLLALGVLLHMSTAAPPQAPDESGFALVFRQAPPASATATPAAQSARENAPANSPAIAAAASVPLRAAPVMPAARVAPASVRTSPPVRRARAAPAAAAPAAPRRAPAPLPAAVAAPPLDIDHAPAADASADDMALIAHFSAQVHDAVNAAAAMPLAARRQHREGRAQVGFAYLDGSVENVTIVQSSQSRILDNAAVSAVRLARLPAAPPAWRGQRHTLTEWIDFRLAPQAPI